MFSLTAFTLPGKVTMRVLRIVPATGRDRAASGVCFKDVERIRWIKPGASRSRSPLTAYDVWV